MDDGWVKPGPDLGQDCVRSHRLPSPSEPTAPREGIAFPTLFTAMAASPVYLVVPQAGFSHRVWVCHSFPIAIWKRGSRNTTILLPGRRFQIANYILRSKRVDIPFFPRGFLNDLRGFGNTLRGHVFRIPVNSGPTQPKRKYTQECEFCELASVIQVGA